MHLTLLIIVGAIIVGLLIGLLLRSRIILHRRTMWLTIAIVIFALGLLIDLLDGGTLHRKWAERSWPQVTGEVISATVGHGRAYAPVIEYRYQVDGATYVDTSDGRAPGFGNSSRRYGAAEAIIQEYHTGAELPVHYNPSNPAQSTLTPGPDWNVYGQLSFGSFLIMLAVPLLLALTKKH